MVLALAARLGHRPGGGRKLFYYRLYFLHPSSDRILRFAEFEASDDGAAIALAADHEDGPPRELWCGGRKVKRFEWQEGRRRA